MIAATSTARQQPPRGRDGGTGGSRGLRRDRQLGLEDGAGAGGARDREPAAEGLDAVGQPPQPGAAGRIRASPAVVGDPHDERVVRTSVTWIEAPEASAYLATLASASEQTKYAAASCGAGNRRGGTSTLTGTAAWLGQVAERLGEAVLGERPRMDALGEAGKILARGIELVDELVEARGPLWRLDASAAQLVRDLGQRLFGSASQLLAEAATLLVAGLDEPTA